MPNPRTQRSTSTTIPGKTAPQRGPRRGCPFLRGLWTAILEESSRPAPAGRPFAAGLAANVAARSNDEPEPTPAQGFWQSSRPNQRSRTENAKDHELAAFIGSYPNRCASNWFRRASCRGKKLGKRWRCHRDAIEVCLASDTVKPTTQ